MIPLALASIIAASPMQTETSWYGYECADQPMANGQPFNPTLYTCASWDYPLGQILRVTCLDTGRSVDVVCTDRGPAKRLVALGRRLDLSQAAFERINDTRKGVTRVVVED